MRNSLLKNFFSSGLQAVAVQVLGILFFYVISLYLPKEDFGIISWANAITILLTTLLSFGLEQVITRRIASSSGSGWAAAAFFFHALAGSVAMLIILAILTLFWPQEMQLQLLPWFFSAQALVYIAAPFKQYLNAKEQFTPYGVIAFATNLLKITTAIILIYHQTLSILSVLYILIGTGLIELLALSMYVKRKENFSFSFKWKAYPKLLKESSAQYIAIIFDNSLSRLDWVLLGLISTNTMTADYSFAYRAFEIGKLPLVIIAPVLLVRFSRQLTKGVLVIETERKRELQDLFSIEMFLAILLPLCLNIVWGPWVDVLTNGKYGYSNADSFFVLTLCLPFQFFINLLWTITFAGKNYKIVSRITMLAAAVNLILNLALIPYYGGIGAACAFLITIIIQTSIYYWVVRKNTIAFSIIPLFSLLVYAAIAYYAATTWVTHIWLQIILAVALYCILAISTKQIGKKHLQTLKLYLKK